MYRWYLYIVLIITPSIAQATDYYVTTVGNDANDGLAVDSAHAFLTPGHGCSVLTAGDTLYIKGDGNPYTIDYNDQVNCSTSGTAGNIITIQAYDTADPPTISWLAAYTGGWDNMGGNVWRSTSKVLGTSNTDIQGFYKYDPTNGNVTILNKELTSGAVDAEGDFFSYNGTSPAGKVLFYSATNPNTYTGEWRFISGLDTSGADGINYASYQTYKFINTLFTYDGFAPFANSTSNVLFEDCHVDYFNDRGFSLLSFGASGTIDNIICRRCNATHGLPSYRGYFIAPDQEGYKFGNGPNAILATNLLLEDCQASYNGYHNVQISNSSSNVTIRGGVLHHSGQNVTVNTDPADIRIGPPGTVGPPANFEVTGVEMYSSQNCITIFGLTSNIKIHNNYCHGYSHAGIYDDTTPAVGSCANGDCYVYNNIFANSSAPAFYLDDVDRLQGYDNTVVNAPLVETVVNDIYSVSAILKNNIVISVTGQNIVNISSFGLITSDYNAFYSPDTTPFLYGGTSYNFTNYKAASSQDSNSINSNFTNEFNNYTNGDYGLTYANSPTLRDAGTALSIVTDDYTGRSRPKNSGYAIGAYEEPGQGVEFEGITASGIRIN